MKKIRIKLMGKLLTMSIVPAIIVGLGSGFVGGNTIETSISSGIEDLLHSTALSLSETVDITELQSYQHLLDHYKSELQMDTTIFIDDRRELTTVAGSLGSTADPTIYSHVKQGKHYFATDANVNGVEYFGYYIPLYDENENFIGMTFAGKPTEEMNKILTSNVTKTAVAVLLTLIIISPLVVFSVKRMNKCLNAAGSIVRNVANGDLSIDTDINLSNDEIGDVGRDTLMLVEKLTESIGNISESAVKLDNISGEMNEIVIGSNEAAEEITQAITQIAIGANNQASETQTGADDMSKANEKIVCVREQAKSLVEIGHEMRNVEEDVKKQINASITLNSLTNDELKVVDESVKRTSVSVDAVVKAMNNINDITSQIELLSLNASIEAARAGEAGRGFAVVATNVGELAKQSKETSEKIEKMLSSLISDHDKMEKTIANLTNNISEQSSNIESTSKQFNILDGNINDVIEHISVVDISLEELEKIADSIVEVLGNLSAISEENAAATEETTARTEEVSANIAEIANSSGELKNIASRLIKAVEYFKM